MDIVKEPSCFDRRSRGSDFYRKNRRSHRELLLDVDYPALELICCRQLTEVHLLAGAHYRQHHHDFLSVESVERGRMLFRNADGVYRLEAGEVFLFQPNQVAEFLVEPGEECVKRSFMIQGKLLAPFLALSKLDATAYLLNADRERMLDFFDRFELLANLREEEEGRRNGALSYQFLQFLQSPRPARALPPMLAKLTGFLKEHLHEPISLERMEAASGCPRSRLAQNCRAYLNATPYQLLIELRMRRAAQLLLGSPALSVKEISGLAGYSDALNFSTEFRKYFGVSPRDYRKHKI